MNSFINDYEQMCKMRKMEFSLLSLLTIEIVFALTGYLNGIFVNIAINWFYSMWILNLLAATVLINFTTGYYFAVYRIGFRLAHLMIAVYVLYNFGQMPISIYSTGFCFFEVLYLAIGLSIGQMTYPGKWIVGIADKWNNIKSNESMEKPRDSTFPIFSLDMDLEDEIVNDDFSDDLFDYYTAFEDDIPYDNLEKKYRGTFII